jgi:hypothetical protein
VVGAKQSPQSSQLNFMSTYRSPSINGMTVVIVAGWVVINLALFLAAQSSSGPPETPLTANSNASSPLLINTVGRSWMAGTIFGLIASISWLATSVSNSFARFSIRIMAGVGCVLLLPLCSTPDLLRHALGVSGLILVQPFIFLALAIPDWGISFARFTRLPGLNQKEETSQKPKLPQFHVGELITLTALVALLLAASRLYTPPVASLVYWPVLIGSWLALQTIAGLTIRVVMFRQLQILLCLLPLIVLTAFGLANAQGFVSDSPWQAGVYFRLYSFSLAGFAFSIAALCLSRAPTRFPDAPAIASGSSTEIQRPNCSKKANEK